MTKEEAIKIINCYDLGFYDLSGEKIPADKLAEAFDMAIEALSADRPQGEWVDYGDCEDICSICGYSKVHEPNYPFCPNGGADMRERREE